jgi:lipoate synthase
VVRYIPPDEFEELRVEGEKLGFHAVFSAPLVRSPFQTAEIFPKQFNRKDYGECKENQSCPN